MPSPQWVFLAALVVMLGLLHWTRRFFWLFSILVLPGTLAHEGCHLVLGFILNGRRVSTCCPGGRGGAGRWVR